MSISPEIASDLVLNDPFITVTSGMSGYFAVLMVWNEEHGGFYEPYTTGFGRYKTPVQAAIEAKEWAEDEEVNYIP
jgi:hypothetical protein